MKLKSLSPLQAAKVRSRWRRNADFLGFPDAERDSLKPDWADALLTRPNWFDPATRESTTIVVGRKGGGKSAARIAGAALAQGKDNVIVVSASADELAARYAHYLEKDSRFSVGSVHAWCQVYADLVVREVATQMSGKLITRDDEEAIRRVAVLEGVTERDFTERVVSAIKALVPWAEKLSNERGATTSSTDRVRRVSSTKNFAVFVDDFDNLQEKMSHSNLRLIRDAIEAADRITSTQTKNAAFVHLFMRQDLWLRLEPGWHYADKVAGLVQIGWTQDELKFWIERRMRHAIAVALEYSPHEVELKFDDAWSLFFPSVIDLHDEERQSSGLHYIVRRTMYTPRSLQRFLRLIVEHANGLPADQRAVEDAEDKFSVDQLEFLKTEYGGLCDGLDVCLQSFTGRTGATIPSDLYRHLKGLIGNGQVSLHEAANADAAALARFLFRIGFLEVRYPDGDRYEVRDAMRHPEHWQSIRKDDAVRWAVRSAFYCALRTHR